MDLENIRQYRIFGISIFDVASAVLGFYILDHFLLNDKLFKLYGYKFYIAVLPIGVISHLLIKQKTFLNTQLFSSEINVISIVIKLIVVLSIFYIFF